MYGRGALSCPFKMTLKWVPFKIFNLSPGLHVFNDWCSLSGADPGMGRSDPGPLFWQPNYANSALFGAISAIQPPLFINLDTRPPLFTNPASAPAYPEMPLVTVGLEGVKKLLHNINVSKVIRPDGIPNQIAADELAPVLQQIFQQSLDSGDLSMDGGKQTYLSHL